MHKRKKALHKHFWGFTQGFRTGSRNTGQVRRLKAPNSMQEKVVSKGVNEPCQLRGSSSKDFTEVNVAKTVLLNAGD
jgi:hypothetical protein